MEIALGSVTLDRTDNAKVLEMLQGSKAAAAAGRSAESDQLLARVSQLAPTHPAVLNELGVRMLQRGDADKARALFERATQADPGHPALWSNLASSLRELRLPDAELEAIERALAIDPRHLGSLLQKGTLLEELGSARSAARVYRNALATIPPGEPVPESVEAALKHARVAVATDDAALAAAIEECLDHQGEDLRRARKCIDILTGKRARFFPNPSFMLFPEIPALEFFERDQFPWLDKVEAATQDVVRELTSVLVVDRAGLEPYIAYPQGVPLNQWRDLNRSRRWSAYFLWNQGTAQPAHMARCPRTAAMLEQTPRCDVAERAPTAYFSILDANTRIPAHTGVTNTRLIVHLPLIVPRDCGFRVGNETREWVPGKAWVFDDTIEHEAWNGSDTPRAILIFDIWNPYLSEAERAAIRAATEVVGKYYGSEREYRA